MRIDELPGIERNDAAWWKLVAAMGVIRKLEARIAELEAEQQPAQPYIYQDRIQSRIALALERIADALEGANDG